MPTEKAHGFQIAKMCESFASKNIEVELVVSKRKNKIKEDVFSYYRLKDNFKLTYLPCLDLVRFNLGKLGLAVQMVSFLVIAKIYTLSNKYDVLYTREQELAGLFFNNYILEMHYFPEKITYFHKKCWQKAAALVVLTSCIKKQLEKYGVDSKKILISPDGVDLDKFNPDISQLDARQKVNLPLSKKIILYTGSFYFGWKGADIFLETEKYLDNDCLLVLIGGSEEEIKDLKEKYPSAKIVLVSRKPREIVSYYQKAADVLVLPNKKGEKISEEYTSPLRLFEHMASGRPIVASDLPSIREILNENNAVLVEPNQSLQLAAGIEKVIKDQNLSKRIAQQAQSDVAKYSWQNRAKNILNFINDKI